MHVNDHDFRSSADGMAVPHGLYDMTHNIGYLTIGTSNDTSEFAIASIRLWWLTYGIFDYPNAMEILLLCDCGGSNNARNYIFKQDLQGLADELGIAIRIAHYPPYTSKYNPIEHRLFPHVSQACQGVIFKTIETARHFMANASTKTGLSVFASILDQVFETKRKVTADFKENIPIHFDDFLPKWNYVARPSFWEVPDFI
ncbi:MAG TPA: ISAzo13 family transposase [Caldilineaceae bacterium]|nr:ISAzo13 family transposase [Caldilineaceae bacterium]